MKENRGLHNDYHLNSSTKDVSDATGKGFSGHYILLFVGIVMGNPGVTVHDPFRSRIFTEFYGIKLTVQLLVNGQFWQFILQLRIFWKG